jgi:hypothetical protein
LFLFWSLKKKSALGEKRLLRLFFDGTLKRLHILMQISSGFVVFEAKQMQPPILFGAPSGRT